jgi:hypothetical protein
MSDTSTTFPKMGDRISLHPLMYDYLEVLFDVSQYIAESRNQIGTLAFKVEKKQGHGGLYDLAVNLTNEFRPVSDDYEANPYFDQLEAYLEFQEQNYLKQFPL